MSLSEPPKPSLVAPGYQLDRYEMLCPIAEGGMASVWVARLTGKRGFEKLVAIKTILPKYAQDPRFERMFLDEAGLAARIEHANVAQVLDLGEEHDVLYLAMELVDGDSLSKLLSVVSKKNLTVPTGIVLRILADTCGGLHAAHEVRGRDGGLLHVVHRDVSPQNIMVTNQGVAKLIDFGIAKARDRVSEDTSDGQLKGKVHYMAPEQAIGRPVDRRADIFAVGAIIYFLLAGKPPFAGGNEMTTLFNLINAVPAPPLPDTVHPAVAAVILKAIAHDPEARYATAAELGLAIEQAMIDAGLATTVATVAAYVQEHMAERSKRRKEGLDLALSAAAHRAKVAKILEHAGADTPSGSGVPSGRISTMEASYSTVAVAPSARATVPDVNRAARRASEEETVVETESTEGSLSASGESVDDEEALLLMRPRRRLGWVVAAILAVVAFPVVLTVLFRPSTHATGHRLGVDTVPSASASSVPDAASEASAAPVIAWSSLPMAPSASAPSVPSAAPVFTGKPKGRPPSTGTGVPKVKERINDGF